ncbi:MAG: hypothetical protein N2712_07645 [Brevinematales bacterium]|nr:hypothetical protein [Brevinematales bacterium]
MNKKKIISLIVILVVIAGFGIGVASMVFSQSNRDNFANTIKDIKNNPFMGHGKKR